MLTLLTILVLVFLLTGFAGMAYCALNGCLFAQFWFVFGGAGHLLELIGECIAAIAKGVFEG